MHTNRSSLGSFTTGGLNNISRLRNLLCISHGQKRHHVLHEFDLE
jgi:hypothetical protein